MAQRSGTRPVPSWTWLPSWPTDGSLVVGPQILADGVGLTLVHGVLVAAARWL